MSGEGNPFGINGSLGTPKKRISINFSKSNTKCPLSLHYSGANSYLFVNRKEIYEFKADDKNLNSPTQFCLGSIPNKSGAIDSGEVSLKGNGYEFSVGCNNIDKSDILNIQKYLMVKNNIK